MKKTLLACTLSLATISAFAQSQPEPKIDGYVVSSDGHAVKTTDGSCVRTGFYNPDTAYHPDCNPIKKVDPTPPVKQPDPIVPVVEKKVETQEIKVYFAFDSAVLTSTEQAKIDTLLNNVDTGEVTIVAGTDFIGTEKYNQRLSEQRAQTIANYVKSKANVHIASVTGVGETEAQLQNTEACKKVKHNRAKLIKCVADDRFGSVVVKFEK